MITRIIFDDDGGVARIGGNGLSGGYGVRDLMQGSAHEHAVSLFAHVKEAVAVQEGIDEHGDGSENHDRAHGDAAFIGFALNHGFGGGVRRRPRKRSSRRL